MFHLLALVCENYLLCACGILLWIILYCFNVDLWFIIFLDYLCICYVNEIWSTDAVRSIGFIAPLLLWDLLLFIALLYMDCCCVWITVLLYVRRNKIMHTWQSCKTFAFSVCLGHLYLIDLHIFYWCLFIYISDWIFLMQYMPYGFSWRNNSIWR